MFSLDLYLIEFIVDGRVLWKTIRSKDQIKDLNYRCETVKRAYQVFAEKVGDDADNHTIDFKYTPA